jgi:hypothetical protein
VTNAAHSLETVFFHNIYETTFRFLAGSEPEAFHPGGVEKKTKNQQ